MNLAIRKLTQRRKSVKRKKDGNSAYKKRQRHKHQRQQQHTHTNVRWFRKCIKVSTFFFIFILLSKENEKFSEKLQITCNAKRIYETEKNCFRLHFYQMQTLQCYTMPFLRNWNRRRVAANGEQCRLYRAEAATAATSNTTAFDKLIFKMKSMRCKRISDNQTGVREMISLCEFRRLNNCNVVRVYCTLLTKCKSHAAQERVRWRWRASAKLNRQFSEKRLEMVWWAIGFILWRLHIFYKFNVGNCGCKYVAAPE